MFIEKSKYALHETDAHAGERDYLFVSKDDVGLDIKVPSGKTKLKITKGFGKGNEVSQEFDVVGSGDSVGVENMNEIVVGNAFVDDYCEAYSGYGVGSQKNSCAPRICGYKNRVAIYRTHCPREFFEFTPSQKQKIELYVNDTVLIEKTYSAELKQNLNVRETLGLKLFEEYFGTGVILNELHEEKRIFFADGLPITIATNNDIIAYKESERILGTTYGLCYVFCAYQKSGNGYVCKEYRIRFYFLKDDDLFANSDYLKSNFRLQSTLYGQDFIFGSIYLQMYALERNVFVVNDFNGDYNFEVLRESFDELTDKERMVMDFFKIATHSIPKEKITTIDSRNADYEIVPLYPKFYAKTQHDVSPTKNTLDTSFKYLKEIQSIGLYPADIMVYLKPMYNSYKLINYGYGYGWINGFSGWNNKDVMAELRRGGRIISRVGGYFSGTDTVSSSSLFKGIEFIPNREIWGGVDVYTGDYCVKFYTDTKKFVYDATTTPCSRANVQKIITTYKMVNEYIGGVKKIDVTDYDLKFSLTKDTVVFWGDGRNSLGKTRNEKEADFFYMFSEWVSVFFVGDNKDIKVSFSSPYQHFDNNKLSPYEVRTIFWASPDFFKQLLLTFNNLGAVFYAQDNILDIDGRFDGLVYVYHVLNSKGFILNRLQLRLDGVGVFYRPIDVSRVWTTYADGHFNVRELIGTSTVYYDSVLEDSFFSFQIPEVLKSFLEEDVISKMNTIYQNLKSLRVHVGGWLNQSMAFSLTDAQIEKILRDVFNQYVSWGVLSYRLKIYAVITLCEGQSGSIGWESTVVVDDLTQVSVLEIPPTSDGDYSSNDPVLVQTSSTGSELSINDAQPHVEKVTINVSDSGKIRTIVYSSPVEIESISLGGQRIDAINQRIDDGTLRKFSIGSATVTWESNTITIYNFSAVTSLKIGDASFVF